MCSISDEKNLDEIIRDMEEIFSTVYCNPKKYDFPYKVLFEKIQPYKSQKNSADALISFQEIIDSSETFINYESGIWTVLFAILALYGSIQGFKDLGIILTLIVGITILLYAYAALSSMRKKNKRKCFYKLVVSILKSGHPANLES
jgi:hypothetical protein